MRKFMRLNNSNREFIINPSHVSYIEQADYVKYPHCFIKLSQKVGDSYSYWCRENVEEVAIALECAGVNMAKISGIRRVNNSKSKSGVIYINHDHIISVSIKYTNFVEINTFGGDIECSLEIAEILKLLNASC